MTKHKYFLIALAVFSFFVLQSLAFGQGLSEIHMAIEKKGAKWQAGETSMTRLSPEERQKRLGFTPPVLTGKEPRLSLEAGPIVGAPTSLDWRNNGGNFVTPVRNQGGCGSCWAFAATAALESNYLISNKTPGVDLDLSEQVLVSCGNAGSCNGGSPAGSAQFFQTTGIPVESCYPYTATNGSCSSACPGWQSSAYRISSWRYVTYNTPTVDVLKNALYTYGPLSTTFAVYNDFFSYSGGIYHYVTGSLAGYHAVLLVGYDDPGQYFIVKNSWGTYWGEAGYFKIAYSELNSVVGFGDYTVALVGTAPACTYSVGLTVTNFPSAGATGSATVTTTAGCAWTATSSVPWITITGGASGSGNGTVTFSIGQNMGDSRSGTITIAERIVTITQEKGAGPCAYTINPAQNNFTSAGGTGSVGVTAGSGCNWTATSGATWATITAGTNGSGSGTVVYNVTANSSASPRSTQLTIAGKPFAIAQDGFSCTFSISPSSSSVAAAGASGVVSVSAASGCGWTTQSNTSWISVTSGGNGSGNGQVNYTAAANTGTSSRTGSLTIAGQGFTVNQAGAPAPCTYSVTPVEKNFGSGGGSGTLAVTAGTGCTWTAQSYSSWWVSIDSGASGSGTGTVGYTVSPNPSSSPRTTYILAAGKTVKITQDGMCSFTVSPASQSIPAAGASGVVTVTAGAGCAWTAASNSAWITVNSGAGGTGNGQVTYTVAANTATVARGGILTVAGKPVNINQAGGSAPCTYSISPSSQSVPATGAAGAVTVTAPDGCNWTAQSNVNWISLSYNAYRAGSGQVSYTVAANGDTSSRMGTLSIAGRTFTVNQAGGSVPCTYSVSPTSVSAAAAGATGAIGVTAPAGCNWTAQSNSTWITLNYGSNGAGTGQVNYTVAANTGTATRTGSMNVAGQTVTISQPASSNSCTMTINPTEYKFGPSGGTGSIEVTTGSGCAWKAQSYSSWWLSIISGSTGVGSGAVTYSVDPNPSYSSRQSFLLIGSRLVRIVQEGQGCYYSVWPTFFSVPQGGSSGSVSVNASSACNWSAESQVNWISIVYGESGTGSGKIYFRTEPNPGTSGRTGTVTIGNKTITFRQAGSAAWRNTR